MCDSLSTPRPLGPLRDVADELGPTLPALLRGTAAQHEIFAAVLDALRAGPRVLVVEDLHWADEATLDLVRFLARRIAGLPLLLVLTYRDALGGRPSVERGAGRPGLLAGCAPAAIGSAEPAGGRRDARWAGARRGRRAPPDRRAIRSSSARFSPNRSRRCRPAFGTPCSPGSPGWRPSARHSLELLSCAPEPVSRELLDALDVSTTTVGVLAATGLVDRRGRGVAFRHEIARSAVLEATTPGVEPALHAAMIDALEAIGGDPSVLAHHAAAAGDVARILRYAPAAAAESSRSGAHREAVAFYETALRQRRRRRRNPCRSAREPLRRAVSHRSIAGCDRRDASWRSNSGGQPATWSRSAPGTPPSRTSPGTQRTGPSPSATTRRPSRSCPPPTPPDRSASPWPATPSWPPSAATPTRPAGRGTGRP